MTGLLDTTVLPKYHIPSDARSSYYILIFFPVQLNTIYITAQINNFDDKLKTVLNNILVQIAFEVQ